LLRCLNLPARYCTGYISDIGLPPPHAPQDFAAWIEVFIGGTWHTFDPRNNDPRIGRILIAKGRDAADVPLTVTFGPSTLLNFVVTTEEVVEGSENAVNAPASGPTPIQVVERSRWPMGIIARELYASENGDRWFLARDAQWERVFVRHEANPRSGGHVQDIEIGEFLAGNRRSPEHLALLRLIGTLVEDSDLAHQG
jgi:hypothetical protein